MYIYPVNCDSASNFNSWSNFIDSIHKTVKEYRKRYKLKQHNLNINLETNRRFIIRILNEYSYYFDLALFREFNWINNIFSNESPKSVNLTPSNFEITPNNKQN